MAELKTKPTAQSVDAYLKGIQDERKRHDAFTLTALMQKVTRHEPKMWGSSIVGFGTYHYKYASGREGDTCLAGFSPRKAALTLYINAGLDRYGRLLEKLGKHTRGVGCLYIKSLDDVDLETLEQILRNAVKDTPKASQDM